MAQADRGSGAFTHEDWTDLLKRVRGMYGAGLEVSAVGDASEGVDRADTTARSNTEPSSRAGALADAAGAGAGAGSEGQQSKDVLDALLQRSDSDLAAAFGRLLTEGRFQGGQVVTLPRNLFITNPIPGSADAMSEALLRLRRLTREPDTYRPELAAALRDLSDRLARSGLSEEAVRPARESVDIYRTLADR